MRALMLSMLAAGLPFAGCPQQGKVCTDLYAYGVNVTVTDAATGQPINNATLTLTEGTYQETMILFPGSPGNYAGAGERAGTYTLTAVAPGYQSQTINNIVVTSDECHVKGVHLDVALQAGS
jgi:hypothetical protein